MKNSFIFAWLALVVLYSVCLGSPTEFNEAATSFDPVGYNKLLFVYVNFPDNMPTAAYPDSTRLNTLPQGLAQHIKRQSQGVRDYIPEILFNPTSGSNGLWIADYPSYKYGHPDSVATIARYQEMWLGSNDLTHCGELNAEILYKIWDTLVAYYGGEDHVVNPFDGVAAIILVYDGDALATAQGPIGGVGRLCVLKEYFPFLGGAADVQYLVDTIPRGIMLLDNVETDMSSVPTREFGLMHEYGHMMGCAHSPTNGGNDEYIHGLESYYYGTYSVMRNNYIIDEGFAPLALWDLVSLGLSPVVEVSENVWNLEMQDVRLGGDIYRVPVPGTLSQYFLIAYHSGANEDISPNLWGGSDSAVYWIGGLAYCRWRRRCDDNINVGPGICVGAV